MKDNDTFLEQLTRIAGAFERLAEAMERSAAAGEKAADAACASLAQQTAMLGSISSDEGELAKIKETGESLQRQVDEVFAGRTRDPFLSADDAALVAEMRDRLHRKKPQS
jgi:hypothetical protein